MSAFLGILSFAIFATPNEPSAKVRTVLCTTFPIFQITRNVTQGNTALEVELMLPSQLGCPHDYALSPQDMQKLARADVLLINGLGLEEFLGAPIKNANPKLIIIDSSAGIEDIIQYKEQCHSGDKCQHDHGHGVPNPHLFASPRMSARLASNIAEGLSKLDPDSVTLYTKNAGEYSKTMNLLADKMSALGKRLKNNRIVQPHGVFDYLARDIGLEIAATMQSHGGEPSASEMIQMIRAIKEKKVGAIFSEPQYPGKLGETLSKECSVPTAVLDPCATGPEKASLDYYEKVMLKNIETIEATLGSK
ncbi:MAG TPA: metal ABC transporter substrate-binding protein [Victivallales bacterium]|nr:metal ABC transporter substrate-binding protein [Victivallales bacterium]